MIRVYRQGALATLGLCVSSIVEKRECRNSQPHLPSSSKGDWRHIVTGSCLQKLHVSNPLREPAPRSAIQALQLPLASRGLDAGRGIGLPALLLAEAAGPNGRVTGLELSPELLVHAQQIVAEAGLAERVALQEGDVNRRPFDDDTFDWAWRADCVG